MDNDFIIAADTILDELTEYEDKFVTDVAKKLTKPGDSSDQILKSTIHEIIRLAIMANDHLLK